MFGGGNDGFAVGCGQLAENRVGYFVVVFPARALQCGVAERGPDGYGYFGNGDRLWWVLPQVCQQLSQGFRRDVVEIGHAVFFGVIAEAGVGGDCRADLFQS